MVWPVSVVARRCLPSFLALFALSGAALPLHASTITIDAPGCSAGGVLAWNAATSTVYCLGATAEPALTLKIAGPDCTKDTAVHWNAGQSALTCIAAPGAASAAGRQVAFSLPDCRAGSVAWNAATRTLTCGLATADIPNLNVDQSLDSTYDSLTDGIVVLRYLFGVRGEAMTAQALGATAARTDPGVIATYLDWIRVSLDVDNNGRSEALTDGTLIMRYLFGMRGTGLINGVVGTGANPGTAAAIEAKIRALMP